MNRRPLTQWVVDRTKRGRLRRYARAMGWHLTTDGVLVGDVESIAIRAYEDRKGLSIVELVAPAVLPRFELVPRTTPVAQVGDGMREVHTGDDRFDQRYLLRAEDPWLARTILDGPVRSALASAPLQSIATVGERLIGRSDDGLDPLDLLARSTALSVLLKGVPWEAYTDRRTIPSSEAVQVAMQARRRRPSEPLPSVGRRA